MRKSQKKRLAFCYQMADSPERWPQVQLQTKERKEKIEISISAEDVVGERWDHESLDGNSLKWRTEKSWTPKSYDLPITYSLHSMVMPPFFKDNTGVSVEKNSLLQDLAQKDHLTDHLSGSWRDETQKGLQIPTSTHQQISVSCKAELGGRGRDKENTGYKYECRRGYCYRAQTYSIGVLT